MLEQLMLAALLSMHDAALDAALDAGKIPRPDFATRRAVMDIHWHLLSAQEWFHVKRFKL